MTFAILPDYRLKFKENEEREVLGPNVFTNLNKRRDLYLDRKPLAIS